MVKNNVLMTLLAMAVVTLGIASGSAVRAEGLDVTYKGKTFSLPFGVNNVAIKEPTAFYYGRQVFRPTKETRQVAVYSTSGILVIANYNGYRTVGQYSGDPNEPYDPKKSSFNYFTGGGALSSDKSQSMKIRSYVDGIGDTSFPYLSPRRAVIRTKIIHNVYWHDLATNKLVPYSETKEYEDEKNSDLKEYFEDNEVFGDVPDDFTNSGAKKGFDFSNFSLEGLGKMLLGIFIPTDKGGFKKVFNKFIDKLTLDDDELFSDDDGGVDIQRGEKLQYYMRHDNYEGRDIYDTVGSLLAWFYRFILLSYLYRKKGQLFE